MRKYGRFCEGTPILWIHKKKTWHYFFSCKNQVICLKQKYNYHNTGYRDKIIPFILVWCYGHSVHSHTHKSHNIFYFSFTKSTYLGMTLKLITLKYNNGITKSSDTLAKVMKGICRAITQVSPWPCVVAWVRGWSVAESRHPCSNHKYRHLTFHHLFMVRVQDITSDILTY